MQFPVTSFPNEETKFIYPNWEQLNKITFRLAEQIVAEASQFDRIVTLAKGGWPMTRALVDFLQIPEVASVGIKFYQGINQRLNRPEVYQNLPVAIQGERVLLFDDVADTGESLEFMRDFLNEKGVGEMKAATLFYKPHSSVQPDYYVEETNAWIIFPYETLETMELLEKKWQKQGVDQSEIKRRFKQLKIRNGYINHYRQLQNL